MVYELVDMVSHRETPFDKIHWYVILSLNDKYFFNTFSTTEYEPLHSQTLGMGKVVDLEPFHIDLLFEIYKISGSKMEQNHYDRIMGIKRQITRDFKIDRLLNE